MVLREENVVGEYFDNMLDLLVSLKNGYVNGTRVRIGRIHQLLNTGCIEHVDFVNMDNVNFDIEVFKEYDAKAAHIKSKSNLRPIAATDDITRKEKDFRTMDDHTLFQIVARNDLENLRAVAFSIGAMQKRYSSAFVVQGETLGSRMEKVSTSLPMASLVARSLLRVETEEDHNKSSTFHNESVSAWKTGDTRHEVLCGSHHQLSLNARGNC
jgi:phosphorylase kinase alpha/beta subunit